MTLAPDQCSEAQFPRTSHSSMARGKLREARLPVTWQALSCRRGQPTACPWQKPGPKLRIPVSFQYIPLPVLYGVFLYMGVASLNGIQVRFSPPQPPPG